MGDHVILKLVKTLEAYENSDSADKHTSHATYVWYPIEYSVAFTRNHCKVPIDLNSDLGYGVSVPLPWNYFRLF